MKTITKLEVIAFKKQTHVKTPIIDIRYTIMSKEPIEYKQNHNIIKYSTMNSYTTANTNHTIISYSPKRKYKTVKAINSHHPGFSFPKNSIEKPFISKILLVKHTHHPKNQIILSSIIQDYTPALIENFNKGIGTIKRDTIDCDPWGKYGKNVKKQLRIKTKKLQEKELIHKPLVPTLTIEYKKNKSNINQEFVNLGRIMNLFNNKFQDIRNIIDTTTI